MFMFFLVFSMVLIFFLVSFHSLIILLFIEFLVLFCVLVLLGLCYSWFLIIMFVLFCVCLGAYGVSLLVSESRGKGFSYVLSF